MEIDPMNVLAFYNFVKLTEDGKPIFLSAKPVVTCD